MGTPDETVWPGVTQLQDYKSMFPQWEARSLDEVVPMFDDKAKDLLMVSVTLPKNFFFWFGILSGNGV